MVWKPIKEVNRQMLYGAMNSPIRPLLEELEAFSRLGFDYLELTMDPPRAHYKTIHKQKENLLRALDRCQMSLICHLPTFVSTADLTDSLRKSSVREVLESLKVAAGLGAHKVVLHPSIIGGLGILVMDQARGYAMKSLEAIVEKADQLGIVLCVENMFPRSNSLVDPEDFVAVFEKFPALKMALDTGHAHLGGEGVDKTLNFIRRFSGRIGHIHANDNFGREDNHLPIGTGTIDFPEIITALKGIGYDETITLEIFSQDRDYLRISREKLAAMVEAL